MKKTILLSFALLLAATPLSPAADTIYVGPGYAYNTIQAAINAASNGDTVIIAPGRYTGDGNRDIDFEGLAITVRSTDPNDPDIVATTVIDCNGTEEEPHRGFSFTNGEDSNSILNGFTIVNGYSDHGGGIYCKNSSPTITNCIISGNTAASGGGGISCQFHSNPTVINCIFSENSGKFGGGMNNHLYCNATVTNCIFTNNTATSSGGGYYSIYSSHSNVTSCTFSGNSADWGGGVYIDSKSNAVIANSVFSNNSANVVGGGLEIGGWSTAAVATCTFTGNSANYCAGALAIQQTRQLKLTNCTFAENSSSQGGAIHSFISAATITNCTFAANAARKGGALACDSYAWESDVRFVNCILWDGGNEIWINDNSTVTITYSDVQGGTSGTSNINADPLFFDPVDGDYHLLPSSPCIDAGDPDYPYDPNETDLDGNPRVIGGCVDMGAFEANYIEVAMKFTPQALNPDSQGKWVKAHLVLPDGFAVEDVDVNVPAKLYPLGIESDYINVFINEDDLVEIEIGFGRSAFCGRTDYGPADVTVIGLLTTGQYFYGTDTIRIIADNLKYLAVFASYWLDEDCGAPDWCNGFDLDRNSVVNFIDFAMFDSCCVEIITQ